jgi:hypothetical protein
VFRRRHQTPTLLGEGDSKETGRESTGNHLTQCVAQPAWKQPPDATYQQPGSTEAQSRGPASGVGEHEASVGATTYETQQCLDLFACNVRVARSKRPKPLDLRGHRSTGAQPLHAKVRVLASRIGGAGLIEHADGLENRPRDNGVNARGGG